MFTIKDQKRINLLVFIFSSKGADLNLQGYKCPKVYITFIYVKVTQQI